MYQSRMTKELLGKGHEGRCVKIGACSFLETNESKIKSSHDVSVSALSRHVLHSQINQI